MELLSVLVRLFSLSLFLFLALICFISRLGNNVRGVHRASILTLLTFFSLCQTVIPVLRTCLFLDLWLYLILTTFLPRLVCNAVVV